MQFALVFLFLLGATHAAAQPTLQTATDGDITVNSGDWLVIHRTLYPPDQRGFAPSAPFVSNAAVFPVDAIAYIYTGANGGHITTSRELITLIVVLKEDKQVHLGYVSQQDADNAIRDWIGLADKKKAKV